MPVEYKIDSGFTDIGRFYIEKTITIFNSFEVSFHRTNSYGNNIICIDGSIFGNEMKNFKFNLLPQKTDVFDIQVLSKGDKSGTNYMFGILFFTENDLRKAHVYHNGHGPFEKLFGFKYEH